LEGVCPNAAPGKTHQLASKSRRVFKPVNFSWWAGAGVQAILAATRAIQGNWANGGRKAYAPRSNQGPRPIVAFRFFRHLLLVCYVFAGLRRRGSNCFYAVRLGTAATVWLSGGQRVFPLAGARRILREEGVKLWAAVAQEGSWLTWHPKPFQHLHPRWHRSANPDTEHKTSGEIRVSISPHHIG